MEYACHGSLDRVIRDAARPFPWRRRVRILLDIAKGLVRLHGSEPQVVHTDLKPHNVLIARNWRAKLCDFGCSKLSEYTKAHTTVVGSPAYMCPESRVPMAQPVPEWDIYAFAVVMFALLTRMDPWAELSSEAQLDRQLQQGARPVVRSVARPRRLCRGCKQC
jgi:serine/threonine protein kinase